MPPRIAESTQTAPLSPKVRQLNKRAEEQNTRDASVFTSANMIAVACKMPSGHIMQLEDKITVKEPTQGGGYKEVVKWVPRVDASGKPCTIKLNGCATKFGVAPDYTINQGYAITMVPLEFWNEWFDQKRDSPLLENRIIFAAERQDQLNSMIKEEHEAKTKSGFEPIDPKKPPVVGIRPANSQMT